MTGAAWVKLCAIVCARRLEPRSQSFGKGIKTQITQKIAAHPAGYLIEAARSIFYPCKADADARSHLL